MLRLMVVLLMPMVRVLPVAVLSVGVCVVWVVVGRCWAWALAILGRGLAGGVVRRSAPRVDQMMARLPQEICWVLGLLVMPMMMQVMHEVSSLPAMPTAGALFLMSPKVRVPWVMYRVLLLPVLPTVRLLPLMLRVIPLARVLQVTLWL